MIALAIAMQVSLPSSVEKARARSEAALPICAAEMRAHLVRAMTDLPPDVLAAVRREFADRGGLADAGQPFNSTDVHDPDLPDRQFIDAIGRNSMWLIRYIHGGRGQHHHLVGFESRTGDWRLSRSLNFTAGSPEAACAAAKAIFVGVRSGGTEY